MDTGNPLNLEVLYSAMIIGVVTALATGFMFGIDIAMISGWLAFLLVCAVALYQFKKDKAKVSVTQ